MTRAMITLVLTLALSAAAAARTLELVEGAYEVRLGDVTLPRSAAGSAVFTPCADCDSVGLQVTSSTRYFVSDRALPLPEFLEAVAALREATDDGEETLVGVFFDLRTNRVTRITVFPPR